MSAVGPILVAYAALVLGAIVLIITKIGTSAISTEALDRLPDFAEARLDAALKKLPPDERDRYEQTWRAEIEAARNRPLTLMYFCLGLGTAARRIAAASQRERSTQRLSGQELRAALGRPGQ